MLVQVLGNSVSSYMWDIGLGTGTHLANAGGPQNDAVFFRCRAKVNLHVFALTYKIQEFDYMCSAIGNHRGSLSISKPAACHLDITARALG